MPLQQSRGKTTLRKKRRNGRGNNSQEEELKGSAHACSSTTSARTRLGTSRAWRGAGFCRINGYGFGRCFLFFLSFVSLFDSFLGFLGDVDFLYEFLCFNGLGRASSYSATLRYRRTMTAIVLIVVASVVCAG